MKRTAILSILLFSVAAHFELYAARSDYPLCTPSSLEPPEAVASLCRTGLPSELSPAEILNHGLILSGIEQGTPLYTTLSVQLNDFINRVTAAEIMRQPPLERGETVLLMLHKTFFKTYKKTSTLISDAVRTGSYNCVSSAVLYLAAARAAGLDAHGEGTEDHAFCSVRIGERSYDVETTNRYGFNPGSKKEFHDSFGKTTGFAYVPVKNYARRESMPDRAFLGLILANRSVLACTAGDYQHGIQCAAARTDYVREQDGSPFHDTAAEELDKVSTNYAKMLQKKGNYAEALAWADTAITRRGFSYIWQSCLDVAVYNAAAVALNHNAPDTAENYIDSWRGRLSHERSAEIDAMVFIGHAYRDISNMTPDQKLQHLDSIAHSCAAAQHPHSVRELSEMRESSWLQKAEQTSSADGFLAAAAVIDAALRQTGTSERLSKAKTVYIKNYCVSIHNAFAALYNKRDFLEARDVVAAGLVNVPDSAMLKKDLAAVTKMISKQ